MEPPATHVRIGGYAAASLLLEREPKQWHTLILLDSGKQATDFVNAQSLSSLVLRFDDVEGQRPNLLPPTALQIAQALTYAKGKERLLVSCRPDGGEVLHLRTSSRTKHAVPLKRWRYSIPPDTARTGLW